MCSFATAGLIQAGFVVSNLLNSNRLRAECIWHPSCQVIVPTARGILLLEGARAERSRETMMAKHRAMEVEQEPVGIVISQGSREEQVPRFTAYVWGPAPEPEPSGEMVAA